MRLSLRSVFLVFLFACFAIYYFLSKNGFQGYVHNQPVYVFFEGNIAEHSGMVRVIHQKRSVALAVLEFSSSLEFSKVKLGEEVLMASRASPCILILFSEKSDFLLSTSAGCFTGDREDWAEARQKMPTSHQHLCDLIDSQVLQ